MPKAQIKELSFISKFRLNHHSLEHASWRLNGFHEDVWECLFGTTRRTIDFNKLLDDGSLLTDRKNRDLLDSIKRFLCLQTHPLLTGAAVGNSTTESIKISRTLHILDYFMLRSDEFQLGNHGFNLVTANDVVNFIDSLTTHRRTKEIIYEPSRRLTEHLNCVSVEPSELERLGTDEPDLLRLEVGQECALSRSQTIVARAWLRLNDFYVFGDLRVGTEYLERVSRTRLLEALIGKRTFSHLRFMDIELPGLDLSLTRGFARELPAVPVSNLDEDERASIEVTSEYVSVLRSMYIARQHGASLLTDSALAGIEQAELLLKERTKESARFTTLPAALANKLFADAIAFYLEYGEDLVDFYLSLARKGENPNLLALAVPQKLAKLGIANWSTAAETADDFFARLREAKSLFNMLEVLWGAIAVIVCTLTARRVSEIEGLTASSIVEEHGMFFIAVELRKANVIEHRQRALRPMPPIAAEALRLLAKVSKTLQELEYPVGGKLFEVPYSAALNRRPHFGTCLPDLSRCFDRFCDFHQTETDDQGRRYYVRVHQLRRNFALLFFWSGSFGGIEVLRYFLGHSSASMTYRYVTESVQGKVLRRVKAGVAKDLIRSGNSSVEELSQFICEKYGLTLNDLHLLPERDVTDYIEDLMKSGEAEIEPEFFTGPKGEDYRVLYKIKRSEAQPNAII